MAINSPYGPGQQPQPNQPQPQQGQGIQPGQPGPGIQPGGYGQQPRAPMAQPQGYGQQPRAPMGRGAPGQPQGAQRRSDMSWVRTGNEAVQFSQAVNYQEEQRRAEQRERGYWPKRFRMPWRPGPTGRDNMGRVIFLDAVPGPRYWEHALRNPDTGFDDLYEPCPHEWESCPLCASGGKPYVVGLFTVLNMNGYMKKDKATGRVTEHVHPTKELFAVKKRYLATFDRLVEEYGSMRGLEVRLVRNGDKSAVHGEIDPVSRIVQHSDADIEAYLRQMGKWVPKVNREGQVLEPENWMHGPFDYGTFLHKPEASRLRGLYGGLAPVGSSDFHAGGQGQWDQPQQGYGQQPQQGYSQPGPQGYGDQGHYAPNAAEPPMRVNPEDIAMGTLSGEGVHTPAGGIPARQRPNPQADTSWANTTGAAPQPGPGATDMDDEIPF